MQAFDVLLWLLQTNGILQKINYNSLVLLKKRHNFTPNLRKLFIPLYYFPNVLSKNLIVLIPLKQLSISNRLFVNKCFIIYNFQKENYIFLKCSYDFIFLFL